MNLVHTMRPTRPRVYYVGDNRNRENWGCRATSAALEGILMQVGEIAGRCDGAEAASYSHRPFLYSSWMPIRGASICGRIWWRARRWKLAKRLFGSIIADDYISDDLDESIAGFRRYANRYPHLAAIWNGIANADAVVINGEGSMIFSTPTRREAMFFLVILEVAKALGKQTYYVNAMVSDCPKTGRNLQLYRSCHRVLAGCTFITTRDRVSLNNLQEMGIQANAAYVPDALFTWFSDVSHALQTIGGNSTFYAPFGGEMIRDSVDLSSPYICISGSSLAVTNPAAAYDAYDRLIAALGSINLPLLIVPTCGGDAFLERLAIARGLPRLDRRMPIKLGAAVLAKAAAFVSGRFHPSIMASLGGTPCVFLGSNSHKTRSIQAVLGYEDPIEYPANPSPADCEAIVARVRSYLNRGEELRARLRTQSAVLAVEAQKITTLIGAANSAAAAEPSPSTPADAVR